MPYHLQSNFEIYFNEQQFSIPPYFLSIRYVFTLDIGLKVGKEIKEVTDFFFATNQVFGHGR